MSDKKIREILLINSRMSGKTLHDLHNLYPNAVILCGDPDTVMSTAISDTLREKYPSVVITTAVQTPGDEIEGFPKPVLGSNIPISNTLDDGLRCFELPDHSELRSYEFISGESERSKRRKVERNMKKKKR